VDLYVQHGLYKENLVSITKKGMNGAAEIDAMMKSYRDNPPKTIDGVNVTELLDYELQQATDLKTGTTKKIELPKSNVLQFVLEDGSKISARPSGTEPKIKFYFSVHTKLPGAGDYDRLNGELGDRIDAIIKDMKLK